MFKDLLISCGIALKKTINDLYLNYQPMDRKLALGILNLDEKAASSGSVRENKFSDLFERNKPEIGGSAYLQNILSNANQYLRENEK